MLHGPILEAIGPVVDDRVTEGSNDVDRAIESGVGESGAKTFVAARDDQRAVTCAGRRGCAQEQPESGVVEHGDAVEIDRDRRGRVDAAQQSLERVVQPRQGREVGRAVEREYLAAGHVALRQSKIHRRAG